MTDRTTHDSTPNAGCNCRNLVVAAFQAIVAFEVGRALFGLMLRTGWLS